MTSRLPVLSLSLVGLFALPASAQEQGEGTGGAPVTLTIETDQLTPGKGSTFAGVVNWTGQERAFDMFNTAGGDGGTYRRNLRISNPDSVQFRDDMVCTPLKTLHERQGSRIVHLAVRRGRPRVHPAHYPGSPIWGRRPRRFDPWPQRHARWTGPAEAVRRL